MQIKYSHLFLALGLLLAEKAHAASPAFSGNHPWLTGPLLTSSARVVKRGHILLEPYTFLTFTNGRYTDNWRTISVPTVTQFNPQLVVKIGMTETTNFTTTIQGVLNTTQNKSSVSFGDLPVGFEFELYNKNRYSAKFSLQEVFPIGKFQKLEVSKFGTDAGGQGSFVTQLGLTFAKLSHICGDHYLNIRLNFTGGLPTPVRVKGINVYGGDPTTLGKVFPGPYLAVFLAGEFTLTKNLALSCDLMGQAAGSDRFTGYTVIETGFPPSANISIAPAIEYNWNQHVGFITGCWLTLAGRNSNQFTSFVSALNIFY